MPIFSDTNHLHQVTYELNGLRSLLGEILFYFVMFATIYVGIQIGRFIFYNIIQPANKEEDMNVLYQRVQMVEQITDALISHLNREEHVNVFESAPTYVSHPTTPVRAPKGSLTPKKSDIEKALPESLSDNGDSTESTESKKDV